MTWSFGKRSNFPPSRIVTELASALARRDAGPVGIEALRNSICERYAEATGAASCTLFDRRSRAGVYHVTAVPAVGETAKRDLGAPGPSERLCKWLSANAECILVPEDAHVIGFLPDSDTALFAALGTRLVVPLLADGKLIAVLSLESHDPDWRAARDSRAALVSAGRIAAGRIESAHVAAAEHERLLAVHRAQRLTVAGRLAAEVAHEIRNPLAAIKLTIQSVLEEEADWETRRGMLERMLIEVERIQGTVARLLNVGRPETLTLAPANLSEIAATSLEIIRSMATRQKITLEAHLEQPLPVRADPNEMQKVFLNLLMNACQALPDGGRITIVSDVIVDAAVSGQGQARVTITDSGSGVADDWLSRAFEPFFTTKPAGTGLGLPVSLDIVTRHHGTLELTNHRSGGAIALVTMPLRDEKESHG